MFVLCVLCCAVLCCAVLCCAVLCCARVCHSVRMVLEPAFQKEKVNRLLRKVFWWVGQFVFGHSFTQQTNNNNEHTQSRATFVAFVGHEG